jgi:hypothetical protein
MDPRTLRNEQIIVSVVYLGVIFVFAWYVGGGARWTAISVPFTAVMAIGLGIRVRTFLYLKPMNGQYGGYSLNGIGPGHDVITFAFSTWNLVRLRPVLELRQEGPRGNWISYLAISDASPLHAWGFFKYTRSGVTRGTMAGHWGIHEIHIDPDRREIYVTAHAKVPPGQSSEYLLRRRPERG